MENNLAPSAKNCKHFTGFFLERVQLGTSPQGPLHKQSPSGGTHNYLSPVGRSARQIGETPTASAYGAISHSRAGFARESRQARTGVRNWRIERRKARSGKARSLRVNKKKRGAFASRFFRSINRSNYLMALNLTLPASRIPVLALENQVAPLKPRVEPSANRMLP